MCYFLQVRKLVGAVLSNGVQSSKAGPYVPIFYQSCPSIDCSVSEQVHVLYMSTDTDYPLSLSL